MNSFFNFNDFQKQVYRLFFLKVDMNNVVILALVVSGIVIGILAILSLDSFSIIENKDNTSEPILGIEEKDSEKEQKAPGRDLSIEFDEKMGLSAP
jgi:preprotein translocase subunit Sec63